MYHREHPAGFRWLHESFGTNWRMTEMQAVIGRIQLNACPHGRHNAKPMLPSSPKPLQPFASIRLVHVPPYMQHAYYKYYAFIRPEHLAQGWTRDRIIAELNARHVPCYQGSCSEVYLEKAFDHTPLATATTPAPCTRIRLGDTSLMFLVHPTLTAEQMQYCILTHSKRITTSHCLDCPANQDSSRIFRLQHTEQHPNIVL